MTQPTTSARWTVVQTFLTILADQALVATVQIEPGDPGDDNRSESIWVDDITGVNEIPVFGPSRIVRNDNFKLGLRVLTLGHNTLDEAMSRLFEMIGCIEDVFADTPDLDGLDGVLWGEIEDHNETAVRTPEGVFAYGEVQAMIHTRLN